MNLNAFARGAVLAVTCLTVLAGCTDGGPAQSRPSTPDSQLLLSQIGQLWVDDAPVPGYGATFNLEAAPSLYATAWSLRLATAYRIGVPGLDVGRLSDWLRSVVDSRGAGLGMEPMECIRLASQALADLGQAPASGAAAAIASMRGPGGLYRFDATLPESWGATNSALDAMQAAGLPIPAGLRALVTQALPATTLDEALTPADGLELLLPQWQIADRLLAPADRATLRGALARDLAAMAAVVEASPPTGVSAFVAASLVQVGAANGIQVAVPGKYFTPLITPDGMLASASGDDADPKTTFYAAVLGRPLVPALKVALLRGSGPMGWRSDVGAPEAQSSFYATAVTTAMHGNVPVDALRAAAGRWLDEDAAKIRTKPDAASLKDAFFALELNGLVGGPPRTQFLDSLRSAEPAIAAADDAAALWTALIGARSGIDVSPALSAAIRRVIATAGVASVSVVALEWEATRALGLSDLDPTLTALGIPAPLGNRYAAHSGVPFPDIGSTALGYFVDGGPAQRRRQAALTFEDGSGFWLTEPSIHDGNVVDLRTMYLGLWLDGRLPGNLLPVM